MYIIKPFYNIIAPYWKIQVDYISPFARSHVAIKWSYYFEITTIVSVAQPLDDCEGND